MAKLLLQFFCMLFFVFCMIFSYVLCALVCLFTSVIVWFCTLYVQVKSCLIFLCADLHCFIHFFCKITNISLCFLAAFSSTALDRFKRLLLSAFLLFLVLHFIFIVFFCFFFVICVLATFYMFHSHILCGCFLCCWMDWFAPKHIDCFAFFPRRYLYFCILKLTIKSPTPKPSCFEFKPQHWSPLSTSTIPANFLFFLPWSYIEKLVLLTHLCLFLPAFSPLLVNMAPSNHANTSSPIHTRPYPFCLISQKTWCSGKFPRP